MPKKEGGLGLRCTQEMNGAFLMKILWNLIEKPNDLWTQVLSSKYGRGNEFKNSIVGKQYDSHL